MTSPTVLTIAGSDSSGSSGLQADLPTFAALGVHGTSVVTVVTAQNSLGVQAFHALPLSLVKQQLSALLADLAPAATKTGLLWEAAAVEMVADAAPQLGALVVDPVMVNSAGDSIVETEVVDAYRKLCRVALIITPNRSEAEMLIGAAGSLDTAEAVEAAADQLAALGAPTVVVTGGRGEGPQAADVVISAAGVRTLRSARVGSDAIRGTGCTFSAALAAYLGLGCGPDAALDKAHDFVQTQLAAAPIQRGAGLPGVPHALESSDEWGT